MATLYRLELGFNWDRKIDRELAGSKSRYLDHYFVVENSVGRPISLCGPRKFACGDKFRILIYNLGGTGPTVDSFQIRFNPAVEAQSVGAPNGALAGGAWVEAGTIRPADVPSYLFDSISGWEIADGGTGFLDSAGYLSLQLGGSFYFSGSLTLTRSGDSRTFAFDPEMVVGEG